MTTPARHLMAMRSMALLVAAAIGSAPVPAFAQVDPDTAATPDRPFVEGGVYDKPYLTNLLGRTAIGGYAEAHTRWVRVDGVRDELGFELRRWNIFTATQVSDFVRIGAELEFEELGEEITLEFAAIDVGIHPSLTLRAGAILSPLGRFNLAHDSPRNEFTDRPVVSTEVIGTALTEPGIGALGTFGLGRAGRLTYELYAVNGFHSGLVDDSPDGTRLPAGKKNFEDDNNSPAAVGRLAWSPGLGYELGLSGHHGAYNIFSLDGETVDERYDLTIAAVDFEATLWDVAVSGEAVAAGIDIAPGLQGIYAASQRGLFVEAVRPFGAGWVRTMPGSFFAVKTRYDWVDFDADLTGDSDRRFTIGLNFRPAADAVLKLDYVRGRTRDRFNNPGDSAAILFSIATYF
jgi:hypothetical protein